MPNKFVALLPIFMVFLSGCVSQSQPQQPNLTTTTVPTTTTLQVTTTTISATTSTVAPSTSQAKEFKLTIDHSGGYLPNKISVNKGDTVRILAISNQPSHNHGIAIDSYNINKAILKNSFADPDVIEFVANIAGTSEIYCKTCESGPLGSHPWLKGTLEVK